jgi:hypothetical protein
MYKITQIIEKNTNHTTFSFFEEGPGRGSKTLKNNAKSTVLVFSSLLSF